MKSKTIVLLGLAVVFGLIASFLTSRFLSERNSAPAQDEEEKVTVYVAKQNLPYGQRFDVPENYIEEKQYTMDNAPPGAITSALELKDRLLAKGLNKGIPITKNDLMAPELAGLQQKIPPGKRGVALQTNAVGAAGGLILPDNHVDVMLTTREETKVVLSNMLVLAVDTHQKVEPGATIIPQTVTLLADSEQAAVLAHAQSRGKIQMTVRPFNDDTDSSRVVVTDKDLGVIGNGRSERKGEETAAGAADLIALRQITPKSDKATEKTAAEEPAGQGSATPTPVKKRKAFVQVLHNGTEKITNYFDDETGQLIPPDGLDEYDLPSKK